VLLLYLRLIRRYVKVDLRFVWPSIVWLFRQSLAFWAFAVFFTVYLWIDSVILAVMAPPEVLGWYGVPTKLFGTLMFVPTILCTAWFPRLAFAYRQSRPAFYAASQLLLEMVVTLSLPIGVGAALIASQLIAFLYGPSFAPAVPVLVILACTVIPTYMNIVVNQILVASHRQKRWMFVMAGASIFNPALNVLLIRILQSHLHNGAIGAALALLITEILIVGVGVVLIRPALTLHLALRLFRALLATAGMAAVVLAARRFGLAAEMVSGALTFVALALVLGVVTVEEVRDLRGLIREPSRA
jgi:O-antigen/teichoic acid export membrane protein